MKYRADIDGLRALAVVPVVLFHAGFETFSGGFIGVDIFFVISGFLITGIIYGEMLAGHFSILAFYERRVRRILPALCAVLAFALIAGWFILLPGAYQSMSESALATAAFASNIYFKRQTGYFADSADMLPLLHTWSLAVEEQFYIGFPLLLLALMRWGRPFLIPLMLAATVASFALSVWALTPYPEATFYLIVTRAWELAIGALLAMGAVPAAWSSNTVLRERIAAAGLALIVVPIFAYTKETAFPGLAALPPCLGAGAIIWAGMSPTASTPVASSPTFVSRLLALSPIVFVGLISYSLYLWHWPMLVFARHLTVSAHLDKIAAIVAIVLSFIAAAASWRYVERPFRDRSLWNRAQLFKAAAAGTGALVAMAAGIMLRQGVPARFDQPVLKVASTVPYSPKGSNCLNKPLLNGDIAPECRFGRVDKYQPNAPLSFVLWGDSHSAAAVPVFDAIGERTGMAGGISAFTACPALSHAASQIFGSRHRRDCWTHNKRTLDYITNSPSIKFVVLCGYWKKYFREARMYDMSGPTEKRVMGDASRKLLLAGLEQTIERLIAAGKRVVILDKLPEPGFLVPWTMAMSMPRSKPLPVVARPSQSEFGDDLQTVFEKNNVIEIRMDEPICAGNTCKITDGLNPIFGDEHHISEYGAKTYFEPYIFGKLFGPSGVLASLSKP